MTEQLNCTLCMEGMKEKRGYDFESTVYFGGKRVLFLFGGFPPLFGHITWHMSS